MYKRSNSVRADPLGSVDSAAACCPLSVLPSPSERQQVTESLPQNILRSPLQRCSGEDPERPNVDRDDDTWPQQGFMVPAAQED